MRYSITLTITICIYSFQTFAQGTTHFEIWGWNGEKQQFIETYFDSTGTDLNNGYTCMLSLKKMGYEHSISALYIDDIEKFLNGKLNWDSTERLAVIRQIAPGKYSELSSRKDKKIKKLLLNYTEGDSSYIQKRLTSNSKIMELLLIGTLSGDGETRSKSIELLSKFQNQSLPILDDELAILAEMLSFPDPNTTYLAMNLVSFSKFPTSANSELFSLKALTILDFLNSELQSFKPDAIKFLSHRFPNEQVNSELDWPNIIRLAN